MAYNSNHAETNWTISGGQLVDVSTASISYVAAPYQGRLVNAWACISAAVTGTDSVVTVKKKAGALTAVTLGTITVVVLASAPGSTFQMAVTGSEADCTFNAGDTLQFDSDGVSSTTSIANFLAVFKGM